MRVIAGSARGRKLLSPAGMTTRPTPARVREALFSILPRYVALQGACVLDLFAGSGALGIEALSRGALHATFVDCDRRALAAVRRNVAPFANAATLMAAPAVAALTRLPGPFDLTFLDPPYAAGLLAPTLAALQQRGLIAAGGVAVAEHASRDVSAPPPLGLQVLHRRAFGDVTVVLYGSLTGQTS